VHCRVKVRAFTEHYARKRSGCGGGLKSIPKRNLGSTIWSRDTGQRILGFDRCQFTITWISNMKGICMSLSTYLLEDMAAILSDSVVVRTPPRAIITMRKSIGGFYFLSCKSMLLRLTTPLAAGVRALNKWPVSVKNVMVILVTETITAVTA